MFGTRTAVPGATVQYSKQLQRLMYFNFNVICVINNYLCATFVILVLCHILKGITKLYLWWDKFLPNCNYGVTNLQYQELYQKPTYAISCVG